MSLPIPPPCRSLHLFSSSRILPVKGTFNQVNGSKWGLTLIWRRPWTLARSVLKGSLLLAGHQLLQPREATSPFPSHGLHDQDIPPRYKNQVQGRGARTSCKVWGVAWGMEPQDHGEQLRLSMHPQITEGRVEGGMWFNVHGKPCRPGLSSGFP